MQSLRVETGHVDYEIAGPSVLRRGPDVTLVSTERTRANLSLGAGFVRLSFQPALLFVVHRSGLGPIVEDVRWWGVDYRFGGSASAHLERVPAWFAFDLGTGLVRESIEPMIAALFHGTPFAGTGYQPFGDDDLLAHIGQIRQRLTGSSELGAPGVPLSVAGAGIVAFVEEGLVHQHEDATIRIHPRTQVRVDAALRPGLAAGRLFGIDRARFSLHPAVEIERRGETVALSGFALEVQSCGPTVRVDPSDVKFLRHGTASTTAVLFGAMIGVLAALGSHGSADTLAGGASIGLRGAETVAAGILSHDLTLAAGLMLEEVRPRLKKSAPLVDWDAMFCTTNGQPALGRPLRTR